MEVDIEEDCLKALALYQPVAGDLRFIVTTIKINTTLERVGDLAVNIAERARLLAPLEQPVMRVRHDGHGDEGATDGRATRSTRWSAPTRRSPVRCCSPTTRSTTSTAS